MRTLAMTYGPARLQVKLKLMLWELYYGIYRGAGAAAAGAAGAAGAAAAAAAAAATA
jgi:hypothetical protein